MKMSALSSPLLSPPPRRSLHGVVLTNLAKKMPGRPTPWARRSLHGVVLINLAKKMPRRPLVKAREARFVDEGGVVAIFG